MAALVGLSVNSYRQVRAVGQANLSTSLKRFPLLVPGVLPAYLGLVASMPAPSPVEAWQDANAALQVGSPASPSAVCCSREGWLKRKRLHADAWQTHGAVYWLHACTGPEQACILLPRWCCLAALWCRKCGDGVPSRGCCHVQAMLDKLVPAMGQVAAPAQEISPAGVTRPCSCLVCPAALPLLWGHRIADLVTAPAAQLPAWPVEQSCKHEAMPGLRGSGRESWADAIASHRVCSSCHGRGPARPWGLLVSCAACGTWRS